MRLAGSAEMRAIDRAAIDGGVPGRDLMERAGSAVARAARSLLGPQGRALVVCGAGNNGGDGYVAARLLRAEGVEARVAALASRERLQGDARAAREAAEAAGVPIDDAPDLERLAAGPGDVVIDALLGTGLARAPEGAYAAAVARMDALRGLGARLVAVDVPSGLSADTGRPPGACVRADVTVTFGFLKRGLAQYPGADLAGEVVVADIGLPPAAARAVPVGCELLTEEAARALLPPRPADAHKGDAGRVLVVAGSPGKSGAAHLAVSGALRGGAGLVTLAARREVLALALAGRPEAMSVALEGDPARPLGPADLDALLAAARGVDAVVVGPGIPRDAGTGPALRAFLERAGAPAVLDADALNALAEAGGVAGLPVPAIQTPHPGEMARLVPGATIATVQADRVGLATAQAAAWGCAVVLKGARTVVAAPGRPAAVVPTGNPGMATGGTGDVLAGLAGALLAGGLPAFDAARVAAFAHGAAGDLARARRGERGLLATDLLDALGAVWARWDR